MITTATDLDLKIDRLATNKERWARLPIGRKRDLLLDLRRRTAALAEKWVAAGMRAKGINGHPGFGQEEWIGGPWAVLRLANGLIETLEHLDKGMTRPVKRVRTRPGGQVVAEVFPTSAYDRIMMPGARGEVWMQPGVTAENLTGTMADFYKQAEPPGRVGLVLGAGNIAFLSVADVLHKLYTEGQVTLLKLNPVNDYLGVYFEEVFAAFRKEGFVELAYGGAETGAYLATHPGIEEIHITGGATTHDAVVFGTGPEGEERKRARTPVNTRRVTSELGCVTPTIVVPGPWTARDLRFQAEHIVSQKVVNAGANCLAAQVLVVSETWDQTPALLDAIRGVYRDVPPRPAYYPGQVRRYLSVINVHPDAERLDPGEQVTDDRHPRVLITGLDPDAPDLQCFREEFFTSILAETSLPGDTAAEFLSNAVRFANEKLTGTLSANLIIHPQTIKELGPEFEEAIAGLRYGAIGVNTWTAYACLLPNFTWGAFPGHEPQDIQSGTGVVHNIFQFGRAEKSVIYGPFRQFPKPPFVTHRNGYKLGRAMTELEASPGPIRLAPVILAALKG